MCAEITGKVMPIVNTGLLTLVNMIHVPLIGLMSNHASVLWYNNVINLTVLRICHLTVPRTDHFPETVSRKVAKV